MRTSLLTRTIGLCVLAFVARNAVAQSESTSSVLPRADFHFTGTVGRTYKDSDPPQVPQPVQAPKGAPNIVLILIDDTGFGQFSTFGGGVPSPTMDKLAAEGLRFNRFHSAAGPFDHWANGLGFDYFYGFNGGDAHHYHPVVFENRTRPLRSKAELLAHQERNRP